MHSVVQNFIGKFMLKLVEHYNYEDKLIREPTVGSIC